MSKEQLIALAIREGIPAAVRFVRILKLEVADVTPEMWEQLEIFSDLTANDYKEAPRKSVTL